VCVSTLLAVTSGATERALHAGLGEVGHVTAALVSCRQLASVDDRRRPTTSRQHGVDRYD